MRTSIHVPFEWLNKSRDSAVLTALLEGVVGGISASRSICSMSTGVLSCMARSREHVGGSGHVGEHVGRGMVELTVVGTSGHSSKRGLGWGEVGTGTVALWLPIIVGELWEEWGGGKRHVGRGAAVLILSIPESIADCWEGEVCEKGSVG